MSLAENSLKRKPPRFYEPPSEEAIEHYGAKTAELRQRMMARQNSIRVVAGSIAVFAGTALTVREALQTDGVTPQEAVAFYLGAAAVQGLMILRTESLHRGNLKDIEEVTTAERNKISELESHIDLLSNVIQEEGLPLPDEHTN